MASLYTGFSSGRSSIDGESGYASANSSNDELPQLVFTKPHLRFINAQLQKLPPYEILRWAITTLPGLYQETAFGLGGLVQLDMLSKLSVGLKPEVDLIWIDTLYNFDETYDLVERARNHYPKFKFHVFRPQGAENARQFAAKHGEKLWETDEDVYDWTVKVEPSERAYAELGVRAVLTGRRNTQGGKRKSIDIVEVEDTGMIKVNPLANWSFDQVQDYIRDHEVPYNPLLDCGYKSIGDWHSTQPVAEGEDERAGRWKGREKTECGIHNPKSRYAQFLMEQAQREQDQVMDESVDKNVVVGA